MMSKVESQVFHLSVKRKEQKDPEQGSYFYLFEFG